MIYNAPGIGITLSPRFIEKLWIFLAWWRSSKAICLRCGGSTGRYRLWPDQVLPHRTLSSPSIAAGFDGFSSTNSCALPN